MTVECTLSEVMEIWPLQLACQTSERRYHVALTDETVISAGGGHLDPGILRPGMRIRVSGEPSGATALRAHRIEILSY